MNTVKSQNPYQAPQQTNEAAPIASFPTMVRRLWILASFLCFAVSACSILQGLGLLPGSELPISGSGLIEIVLRRPKLSGVLIFFAGIIFLRFGVGNFMLPGPSKKQA